MALNHVAPGEIVDISPLGDRLPGAINSTLLRSENLQVFRVVLRAGEEFSKHAVQGEITIQCLEGRAELHIGTLEVKILTMGGLVYLEGGQPHSVKALKNASLLVTVYHPRHPDKTARNTMARK